jgi:NAD+ diphosphatase
MSPSLPSVPLLSRSAVDRDHPARSRPALFDELWEEPATRVLPMWRGRALFAQPDVLSSDRSPALALLPVAEVTSALVRVYLGRALENSDGIPVGAAIVAEILTDAAAAELEPDENRWVGLRESAPLLSDLDAGLYTEALAIANWHESHIHCPRCGSPTVVEMGGWVRRCISDNTEHFPRTDPAIIVSVLDRDDRILLGSNAMWENNRFSILAGFVEPGESFEAAVLREIFEESGIRVVDPEYLGSQPWPFPRSVMIGYTARIADDQDPADLQADGEEILDLRWFTRSELWEERERVILPGPSSIARAIIEHWYGGPLSEPPGAASVSSA